MVDLISRDWLKNNHDYLEHVMIFNGEAFAPVRFFGDLIKNAPTAYDLDEKFRQLTETRLRYLSYLEGADINSIYFAKHSGKVDGIDEAIRILRSRP